MKILNRIQIRAWDKFTISQQNISGIELMKRAGTFCAERVFNKYGNKSFGIFCGPGNNGGDGFVIANYLYKKGCNVTVILCCENDTIKGDARFHFDHLPNEILICEWNKHIEASNYDIYIDAIFGTGLERPLNESWQEVVSFLSQKFTICIDVPSGIPADVVFDDESLPEIFVKGKATYTFQTPKLACFFPETGDAFGDWDVLPIGLDQGFYDTINSGFSYITYPSKIPLRSPFAHKGQFGHALISAGSPGKEGAAILCAAACFAAGAGLITAEIPNSAKAPLLGLFPEIMTMNLGEPIPPKINALAIGPGWGQLELAQNRISYYQYNLGVPVVIDADALLYFPQMKQTSAAILTPHSGEFDRMMGTSENSFQRMKKALKKAKEENIYIILKGRYSQIYSPDGHIYFNGTGNAGMAKGGSGDVLTGILTGLLARGMAPLNACILGVWMHGKAADFICEDSGIEAVRPLEIIHALPKVWNHLHQGDFFRE